MSLQEIVRNRRVDLLLLLVAALWGGSYLSAKVLTEHVTVPTLLSLRFISMTIAMVVVWVFTRERFRREEFLYGILFGLTLSLIMTVETTGISKTSATNAGLIISLAIIFTPILESLASRRWLPRPFFIAAVVAVVGVALLVSDKGFARPNAGDWFMLLAAIIRAAHVTAIGHITNGKTYSSVNLCLIQSGTCAAVFTIFGGNGLSGAASGFTASIWLDLAFLSLLCGAFAFLVTLWAIRQTSPSRASLLLGTEPVWALAVGVILGGEKLSALGAIGAILIITASYYGQRVESQHRLSHELEGSENG